MKKEKRPKIETVKELKDNIQTLENDLSSGSRKEYEYAVSLVCRGIDFIVYVFGDDNKLHFAPSRFIGYRDNNYQSHKTQYKAGGETTPKIQTIMKRKWSSMNLQYGIWQNNDELDFFHNLYCMDFGKSQNKHKKKFIFLNKKAMSLYEKNKKLKTISKSRKVISTKNKQIVELRAVEYVWQYFLSKNYFIENVQRDNVGWDLNVISRDDGEELKIEVKGLSGDEVNVELTPNEYEKSSQAGYRICVVTNTLKKPNLYIFKKVKKDWIDKDNNRLEVMEKVAARFTMAN